LDASRDERTFVPVGASSPIVNAFRVTEGRPDRWALTDYRLGLRSRAGGRDPSNEEVVRSGGTSISGDGNAETVVTALLRRCRMHPNHQGLRPQGAVIMVPRRIPMWDS
jgi:hypothetical protein